MTRNYVTHHSALLYSVHGYVRVHPSIYIYIYVYMSATVPLETGTHNVRRAFVQYCLSVLGTFLENPPLSDTLAEGKER